MMKSLEEADSIVNGERQNMYGMPEDSFERISDYWTIYLRHRGKVSEAITAEEVNTMLVLFKIAREEHTHKRDNVVDAIGYLAILADRLS